MNTPEENRMLINFLREHPNATLVWLNKTNGNPRLHVQTDETQPNAQATMPTQHQGLAIIYHSGPPITDLRAYTPWTLAQNIYQACQNEPIKLGTQLQPSGADWVGTAGAPCTWLDQANRRHWGILSNWHVMVLTPGELGRTQHQPFDTQPACARLYDAQMPRQNNANLIDAAIADALIDGYHTIDREIIEIGRLETGFADAKPGYTAEKCGRTTGHTRGKCTATGVAARVQYGDFTALFQDQDQYESEDSNFSAAGDSGSLIVAGTQPKAMSLLFAGGGKITLGCPVRHIVARFHLDFGF